MAQEAKKNTLSVKGLFEGLSAAQLTAGALAAVTSMLLSARIGIAGSVIGVAIGSIVSTVASQVYKRFLEQSASKLRDLRDGDGGEEKAAAGEAAEAGQPQANPMMRGAVTGAGGKGENAREGFPAAQRVPASVRAERPAHRATATPHLGDASLAQDVTAQHVREKRAHDKRVQRSAIVVSAVSALIAVAVTAGFVELTTQGQGLGAKPATIEQVVSGSQDANANVDGEAAEVGKQQGASAADNAAGSGATDAQKIGQSESSSSSSSQGSSASGSQSGQSQTETGQGQSGSSSSGSSSSSSGSGSTASSGHDSSSGESTASGSNTGANESASTSSGSGTETSESSSSSGNGK